MLIQHQYIGVLRFKFDGIERDREHTHHADWVISPGEQGWSKGPWGSYRGSWQLGVRPDSSLLLEREEDDGQDNLDEVKVTFILRDKDSVSKEVTYDTNQISFTIKGEYRRPT